MTEEIKVGGVALRDSIDAPGRMSLLLWGSAGLGKTTLACTAPGRKLLIEFDPGGADSVRGREDFTLLDMSGMKAQDVTQFKNASVLVGLDKVIDQYDTIITDSLTTLQEKSLRYGIDVSARESTPGTIHKPGFTGWGARTAYVIEYVRNMLELTAKHNKHCIFIAHEDPPDKDKEGNIVEYPISLGGAIPNSVSIKLSEVWYFSEDGKKGRRISIRPMRQRKSMKSRMFLTAGEGEFPWVYDADKLQGDGIENWFNRWKANGFKKIELPQGKQENGIWY